ncbi:hypothetical protein ACC735_39800, partial [Rhizobium ruizarguesonis]
RDVLPQIPANPPADNLLKSALIAFNVHAAASLFGVVTSIKFLTGFRGSKGSTGSRSTSSLRRLHPADPRNPVIL